MSKVAPAMNVLDRLISRGRSESAAISFSFLIRPAPTPEGISRWAGFVGKSLVDNQISDGLEQVLYPKTM
jgi:hypothetical protein